MTESDWSPLLRISDSGLWLGSENNEWVVGRKGDRPVMVATDPRALLPILESPWPELGPQLSQLADAADIASPLPLEPSLRLALSPEASTYWTDRAVEWLRDGFPIDELPPELIHVCFDQRVHQRTRQMAMRVIVDRVDLKHLLAEHRSDAFPSEVVRGQDYGEVEPVMIDADIFGWASSAEGGVRIDAAGFARARGSLQRSLEALPAPSRPYFERLLVSAVVALQRVS